MALDVTIQRDGDRTTVSAMSLNVSGGGIYLQLREPLGLTVGENVTCEVSLPDETDKPIPVWATGIVVRVDEFGAAVEFQAGSFRRLPPY